MSKIDLKRSESKDDAKSSLRDSGISISEEPSDSEDSYKPEPKDRWKKLCRFKGKNGYYFKCAVCEKKFQGSMDLRRHLLIHSDEKPHVCEICQKAYRQKINLSIHMTSVHGPPKEFVCKFCNKAFAIQCRLKLHLRLHTEEKPLICPHCPKTFTRNEELQQHLVTTHDERQKKTCIVCSSTFSSERSLKRHMDRHEKEGNYLCKICKQMFTAVKSLESHMNSVHPKEKEFECPICENIIKEELHTHMKSHVKKRPHQCDVCKAVFQNKTQHEIHKRRHTGERPFDCKVCWQTFRHASARKLHIRKHTGEKPFKCVLCKASQIGFSQLAHLKTHMKTIHQQDKSYVCEGCKKGFKNKFEIDDHVKTCEKLLKLFEEELIDTDKEAQKEAEREVTLLTELRYLMAVLLKKISTQEKLKKLGFEKRLIDNVLIASLKLANRKCYDNKKLHELDRMKLNIESFLEWIVPAEIMNSFKKDCPSIESILNKIVTMYLEKVK